MCHCYVYGCLGWSQKQWSPLSWTCRITWPSENETPYWDTGENAWSSHTSKSRMGTRGCGREYTPETGNGTWGVSPGPRSTPVSSAKTQVLTSHSVDLGSHNSGLGLIAGTPPCLAFPWTALPSSTICISCHLTAPQPRAQLLPPVCSPVCSPVVASGPLPYTFILEVSHTTSHQICCCLGLPSMLILFLACPPLAPFFWLSLSGSKNL